jgi:hypothetical protein
MSNTWTHKLPWLLVALFMGCNLSTAEVGPELRAASVLFGQFETVFYAKGDVVSSSGVYSHVAENDADMIRLPFFQLREALNALGGDTSKEILNGSEDVLVGAKNFRSPSGLGPVRSKRCYIVILKAGEFDLHKHFRQSPAASVAGAPVWKWSAKLGEYGEEDPRPSLFYAAHIGVSYLLVSNSLEDLRDIATRISSKMTVPGIPDWEIICQHREWGYRRYRHSGVADRTAAGMSSVTPSAEALMFFVDFDKEVSLMRLLSIDEATAAKINAKAKLPPLKSQGKGVWETKIPFAGNEESFGRLAGVMWLFGFGAYV